MSEPFIISVPKESVSDDYYMFAARSCKDGEFVRPGQVIAQLETSKAVFNVESPCAGHIFYLAETGNQLAVNAPLAVVTTDAVRPVGIATLPASVPSPALAGSAGPKFSKAAEKLLAQHGLTPQIFFDRTLVRAEDIEAYLKNQAGMPALAADLPEIRENHVLIWGGGGHGKVCIEMIRAARQFEIYGIVDSKLPPGTQVLGVPVIGVESAFAELRRRGLRHAVLGIGAVTFHAKRRALTDKLRSFGFNLPNVIDPSALVSPSLKMGDGNQIFAHATVSADVTIGQGCVINAGAVVSHDCILGDNVHLAPGALLAGNVHVGTDSLVGMGVTVFLGTKIGRAVRINNGAIVNTEVADSTIIMAAEATASEAVERRTRTGSPAAEAKDQAPSPLQLAIIGAGGFGVEVAWVAERMTEQAGLADWNIVGFVDDNPDLRGKEIAGLRVLGSTGEFIQAYAGQRLFFHCAFGDNRTRQRLAELLESHGFSPATLIDPAAVVSPQTVIGPGAYIGPRVTIAPYAQIGRHVLINVDANVGHHGAVHDFAQLCPGVRVNGYCVVGKLAFLGSNASLQPGTTVGEGATVGANSFVVRDVKPHTVVVGVPARALHNVDFKSDTA